MAGVGKKVAVVEGGCFVCGRFDSERLALVFGDDGGGGGGGGGRRGSPPRERARRQGGTNAARPRNRPCSNTKSPTGIEVTAAQTPGYVTRRARPRCHGCGQIRTATRHECSTAPPWILTASRVSVGSLSAGKKDARASAKALGRRAAPSLAFR